MNKHLALFFTGLVFLLVIFSNILYSVPENMSLQESVDSTALNHNNLINQIYNPLPYQISNTVETLQIEPLPEVPAKIIFGEDLLSGKKYLEKNPYRYWPIASLTKLMTAVIASEKIGFEKTVILDEASIATEGIAGGWQINDRATIKELLGTMMVVSSNDAAMAIANYYGYENFLNEMREKAKILGMNDTVFSDPTGLSLINQSTLSDFRILVNYIFINHPDIFQLSRLPEIIVSGRSLKNINQFVGRENWLGGKTGFIDESGGNLVSIFEFRSRPILIIVFGAEDRFKETEIIYNWIVRNF